MALALALFTARPAEAAQQRTQFDHLTTGFELLGQHRDLPCESCHANAIFKGTPTDCASCHGVGTTVRATAKPATHILSTNRCESCHTPVAWNPAVNFDHVQTMGSCSSCHNGVQAVGKGPQHIVTTLQCDVCHSTVGWAGAVFSHAGITSGCASCHNGKGATGLPANHIPTGNLDCNASGCHTTNNVTTGGFRLGAANINTPTLGSAGHTSVLAVVPACQTCHEAAPYLGMIASTASSAGDSRPTAFDKSHPTTGDCNSCHTTTPTFALDVTGSAGKPANHIPTTAPCVQCHTTVGNYALYSVIGTHKGVTGCLSCHAPAVAGTFANIKITTVPTGHIPIGSLDCNGGGCHGTGNVNAGGFVIGSANINNPTLNVAGHTTVAAAVKSCQTCHEAASYLGMVASTASTAGDSRPTTLDKNHPTTGDCGGCHSTAPTFAGNETGTSKPPNHIPTTAPCAQCHTTAGNFAKYSVTGTHIGVTGCLSCHAPAVATTFLNVTIVSTPANHIPIGNLDCNGSGCHTASNVNVGGFHLGSANINTPTLTVTGHKTVATAVAACQTCHEAAAYLGMVASTAKTAGDSRPTALDKSHPTTGDCASCHSTTPTFGSNQSGGTKPANHIPTTAPCAQCHTTAGNYAVYSVTGTHIGVTGCLSCHAPAVAATFANITITSTPSNHIPIGTLDCNRSGCHSTANVNSGGFHLGSANINTPTLTVTGHTTIASVVSGCQTCHETAPYLGMVASTAKTAGDSRPTALDKSHPTSGDCNSCHTTTPTFGSNQSGGTKPANHIPTTAPCAQCHTTAGNYAVYSVTGTHIGVTGCLSCHAPAVATTFANITITTTPSNHIPIGTLDCNRSGCHSTANVNSGGFHIGSANINTPTLTVTGHTTIASVVTTCQTCHETAPYLGMVASTSTTAGDSRPTALDKSHPTSGDCGGCHTTTPTFGSNQTGGVKPSNHIPTSQPCSLCHTTPGNYAIYVMGAKGHTGITSGCATCHGPTVANTFANIKIKTTPSNHVPYGNVPCERCHSTTNFTSFGPGTQVNHTAVAALACDACHEYNMANMWYGVTNLTVRPGTPPSGHHYPQDCKGCHSPGQSWSNSVAPGPTTKAAPRPGTATTAVTRPTTTANSVSVTASGPMGAGSMSANVAAGATVIGGSVAGAASATVPAFAPGIRTISPSIVPGIRAPAPSIALGVRAPSPSIFMPQSMAAMVDHAQVSGTCVSCHNGVTARGKSVRHIASNNACENCHTTNAWIPARFDHASVVPHMCTTCHDSVHAIGKPRGHVPTILSCDSCHGTLAWTPVRVDHTALTASCVNCHNNANATGKTSDHMVTSRDCASCHRYPDWSAVAYNHTSAAYPGPHRSVRCSACHRSNSEQVVYAFPASAGTCGGCHTKDFRPGAHPKNLKGGLYTASELANCSGACHVYSDSTQSKIARMLPGPRHRVSDVSFKH